MEIDKCRNCGSKKLYTLKENKDSILCMKCGYLHELVFEKTDKLSFILWKRQKQKKEK